MEKQPESKEEKISKILTGISMLDIDEFIAVTPLSKKIGLHKDTLTNKLEEYDPVKNINWKLIRGKAGEIKGLIKTDEDMDLRQEIRNIQKELIEIKKILKKGE